MCKLTGIDILLRKKIRNVIRRIFGGICESPSNIKCEKNKQECLIKRNATYLYFSEI